MVSKPIAPRMAPCGPVACEWGVAGELRAASSHSWVDTLVLVPQVVGGCAAVGRGSLAGGDVCASAAGQRRPRPRSKSCRISIRCATKSCSRPLRRRTATAPQRFSRVLRQMASRYFSAARFLLSAAFLQLLQQRRCRRRKPE